MKKISKKQISLLASVIIAIAAIVGDMLPAIDGGASWLTKENPSYYTVEQAADGDTIRVATNGTSETVRFIGVDTPEKNDSRKPLQCYAQAASEFTKKAVEGTQVRLETDPQSDTRDRYGRLLRYVYLSDGTLLNKELVAQGYGFAMTSFPHSKMSEFTEAQQQAKQSKKGLWGSCNISSPAGYPQTQAVGPTPKH
jgi:micrococcal nuclease